MAKPAGPLKIHRGTPRPFWPWQRKPKIVTLPDPKPFRVTMEMVDGQWRTWKMAEGDAVGFGGIRVDVQGPQAILISRYDENDAS